MQPPFDKESIAKMLAELHWILPGGRGVATVDQTRFLQRDFVHFAL
jgi:hypothetical protein